MSDAPHESPRIPPAASPVSSDPHVGGERRIARIASRCLRCDYDLSGLATGANCPACGSAVAISRPDKPAIETACDASGHVVIDLPCCNCGANLREHLHYARCAACGAAVSRSLRGTLPAVIQSDLRCARCGAELVGVGVQGHCPRCGLGVQESVASGGWTALVDESGLIVGDARCRQCAYNLRGLHRSGRCPECGTSAETSVYGDFLCYADPVWMNGIARGAGLTVWGIVLQIAAFASLIALLILVVATGNPLGIYVPLMLLLVAAGLCGVPGWILFYVGAWKMAAAEPARAEADATQRARRFMRVALLSGLVALPVEALAEDGTLAPGLSLALDAAALGLWALFAAGVVAYCALARRLAQRVPDETLAGRANYLRKAFAAGLSVLLLLILVSMAAARLRPAPGVEMFATCGAALAVLFLLPLTIAACVMQTQLRRVLREQARRAVLHWEWAAGGTNRCREDG
jgi:Zn finger protein HypA/HybF involved in hydrogenase expression